MTKPQISLITLLLLASFASFGAVIFAPALPSIAHYFQVEHASTEWIMSIYLIGYAFGQLVYGPLSSQYGRKSALFVGVLVACSGALLAILAASFHSFPLFIVARLINALGASAGLVVSIIIIKDVHDETNARRTFSKVVLAFAFVPFIAIAIGGIFTQHLGWNSINYIVLLYSGLLLIILKFLPETHVKEKRVAISVRYLTNSYRELLSHREYLRLVFLFAVGGTVNYVFNSVAPLIVIKTMHVSAEFYGWLSVIPSIGILLGGWISSHFAQRIASKQMIFSGVILILIPGFLLTVLFATNNVNLISFYAAAFVIFFGTSLLIPNASMQAISQIKDHANGTSVMNALALALNGLTISLIGALNGITILALPLGIVILGLIAICLTIAGSGLRFRDLETKIAKS